NVWGLGGRKRGRSSNKKRVKAQLRFSYLHAIFRVLLPCHHLEDDSQRNSGWRRRLDCVQSIRAAIATVDRLSGTSVALHLLSRNGTDFSRKFPRVFATIERALLPGTA